LRALDEQLSLPLKLSRRIAAATKVATPRSHVEPTQTIATIVPPTQTILPTEKPFTSPVLTPLSNVSFTALIFLRLLAVCCFWAFASAFIQLPGLQGSTGLSPAHVLLDRVALKSPDLFGRMKVFPSLVWLPLELGLSVDIALCILCVCGLIASIALACGVRLSGLVPFAIFGCYHAISSCGGQFYSFQWDALLLELSFHSIFLDPYAASCPTIVWLLRWVWFRYNFANGVVKLTAGCPQWRSLNALAFHFWSQPLPLPLAWFGSQLPASVLQLLTYLTLWIEIPVPLLMLTTLKPCLRFVAVSTFCAQIGIMSAGNYNFFNFLTLALTLVLLDDDCFRLISPKFFRRRGFFAEQSDSSRFKWFSAFVTLMCVSACLWCGRLFLTIEESPLSHDSQFASYSSIPLAGPLIQWALSHSFGLNVDFVQFQRIIVDFLPYSIIWSAFVLICFALRMLFAPPLNNNICHRLVCMVHSLFAFALFVVSIVPFLRGLDAAHHLDRLPFIAPLYAPIQSLSIVNAYGLFRVMTTDRLELSVEGADSMIGPWRLYKLPFKPHALEQAPLWVMPHHPRLDWQFWFASLGSYQHQPWLVHLVVRLLTNQTQTIRSLGIHNPFATRPLLPRFVRVRGQQYRFTMSDSNSSAWWRVLPGTEREYLPALSLQDASTSGLAVFMSQSGWANSLEIQKHHEAPPFAVLHSALFSIMMNSSYALAIGACLFAIGILTDYARVRRSPKLKLN
jgi:hypothetical protein